MGMEARASQNGEQPGYDVFRRSAAVQGAVWALLRATEPKHESEPISEWVEPYVDMLVTRLMDLRPTDMLRAAMWTVLWQPRT